MGVNIMTCVSLPDAGVSGCEYYDRCLVTRCGVSGCEYYDRFLVTR